MSPHRLRLATLVLCVALGACATGGADDNADVAQGGGGDSQGIEVLEGAELANELVESPSRAAPTDFRRLSVMWTGDQEDAFEISTSSDGGATWSRWQAPAIRNIEFERTGSFLGELVLGDVAATHYRLRATRNQRPSFLRLEFFPEHAVADAELPDVEVAASIQSITRSLTIGSVEVIGKGSWGGAPTRCTRQHTPKRITIHHTVTPNADQMSPEARLRQIQKDHQGSQGWCDIGYHFIISQDGRIFEGTPVEIRGTHTGRNNTDNIGISFLGNFETAMPNQTQLGAAARIAGALSTKYGIPLDVGSGMRGHRDWKATACPGQNLYDMLTTIASLAGDDPPPPPQPPEPPAQVAVSGTVFEAGSASKRIEGARVTVASMTATTDENGEYQLELPPGTHDITVIADGFTTAIVTRDLSADGTFASIGLSPIAADKGTAGVQGVVHASSSTAKRLEGATVFLDNARQTKTNDRGFYRFENLPPGTYTITAALEGAGAGKVTRTLENGSIEWVDIPLIESAPPPPIPEPAATTCVGLCASGESPPGADPECFCDDRCHVFDDCCADKVTTCGAVTETASCSGACFSPLSLPQANGECYCDAACGRFGDCCSDFAQACSNPPAPSCEGICGTATAVFTPSGPCYCDPLCSANGDCCGDYAARCESGTGGSRCEGHCGETDPFDDKGRDCYCDSSCDGNGDCCPGYAQACP